MPPSANLTAFSPAHPSTQDAWIKSPMNASSKQRASAVGLRGGFSANPRLGGSRVPLDGIAKQSAQPARRVIPATQRAKCSTPARFGVSRFLLLAWQVEHRPAGSRAGTFPPGCRRSGRIIVGLGRSADKCGNRAGRGRNDPNSPSYFDYCDLTVTFCLLDSSQLIDPRPQFIVVMKVFRSVLPQEFF